MFVSDGGSEEDSVSLPILDQLPEQVLLNLRLIAAWLLSCGYETDFMQAYATVRSQVLIRSLQKCVTLSFLFVNWPRLREERSFVEVYSVAPQMCLINFCGTF